MFFQHEARSKDHRPIKIPKLRRRMHVPGKRRPLAPLRRHMTKPKPLLLKRLSNLLHPPLIDCRPHRPVMISPHQQYLQLPLFLAQAETAFTISRFSPTGPCTRSPRIISRRAPVVAINSPIRPKSRAVLPPGTGTPSARNAALFPKCTSASNSVPRASHHTALCGSRCSASPPKSIPSTRKPSPRLST